jgi:archaellum component FlaF (FlaF/FlaG flagellin family)
MKLVSTSIIIGSIIISFAIFYSVTHEERARMKYCKDEFVSMAKANGTVNKLKSLEKNIKIICDERLYRK